VSDDKMQCVEVGELCSRRMDVEVDRIKDTDEIR